jgi:hypothetical protein
MTDVSEELTASIIRADSKLLSNVGQYLPDYTAQHPRRQPSEKEIQDTLSCIKTQILKCAKLWMMMIIIMMIMIIKKLSRYMPLRHMEGEDV